MDRIQIINNLIVKNQYQSYLEIGASLKRFCFNKINCANKICVDPSSLDEYDFNCTSDEFFLTNKTTFDIVFIDGLHTAEQVEKDILNSLQVLNNNGSIVVHDTNPPSELHATEKYYSKDINPSTFPMWNGTVWKAIFRLRKTRSDLLIKTYNCDWGVTVITRGSSELLQLNNEYYSFYIFDQNRDTILNFINE